MRRSRNVRNVLTLVVPAILSFAFLLTLFPNTKAQVEMPIIVWIGYTQINGGLFGAVSVTNPNAFTLLLEPAISDGEAIINAHRAKTNYIPPTEPPFLPRASVPGNTNLVYLFPESRSPLIHEIAFISLPQIDEKLRARSHNALMKAVAVFLPKSLIRALVKPPVNVDVIMLEVPLSPNGTNADPIIRGSRKVEMF